MFKVTKFKKNILFLITIFTLTNLLFLQFNTNIVNADNPLYIRIGGPYHGELNTEIHFTLDIQGGVLPYTITWDFGDGNKSPQQFPNHIYSKIGKYSVSVTVVDGEGDSEIRRTNAYVYDPLVANAGGPYSGYIGDIIVISGNCNGGITPYTYFWDLDNNKEYNDAEGKTITKTWDDAGTYIISVKIKDYFGNINENSTEINIKNENSKPNNPNKPHGETDCKTGVEYKYTTTTNDPDNEQVWYQWSWGNNISKWFGPYDSGTICEVSYSWYEEGNYEIKVKAKDIHGEESYWSGALSISITKTKERISYLYFVLEYLLNKIPFLYLLLY